jgi:hypothetical protein
MGFLAPCGLLVSAILVPRLIDAHRSRIPRRECCGAQAEKYGGIPLDQGALFEEFMFSAVTFVSELLWLNQVRSCALPTQAPDCAMVICLQLASTAKRDCLIPVLAPATRSLRENARRMGPAGNMPAARPRQAQSIAGAASASRGNT